MSQIWRYEVYDEDNDEGVETYFSSVNGDELTDLCYFDYDEEIKWFNIDGKEEIKYWKVSEHYFPEDDNAYIVDSWKIHNKTLEIFDVKFESKEQFMDLFPEYFI